MSEDTVLACPDCGGTRDACPHPDRIEMPAREARRLRLAERERLLEAADAILEPGDATDDPDPEPEPEDAP